MSGARCPTCKEQVAQRASGNDAFPFCCRACKMVDLGRWLDGSYRVATGDQDDAPPALESMDE